MSREEQTRLSDDFTTGSIAGKLMKFMLPVLGALVHNAGSVVVILHSAWLLHWKNKK